MTIAQPKGLLDNGIRIVGQALLLGALIGITYLVFNFPLILPFVLVIVPILAFVGDVFQDGIAFTKSPKRQDLRMLWHFAKDVHSTFTFISGWMLGIAIMFQAMIALAFTEEQGVVSLIQPGITLFVGIGLGSLVWWLLYRRLRAIDWPWWA